MDTFSLLRKEVESTRVVVMAGGEGKRMGYVGVPKPLIQLNGVPLIDRCIGYFKRNGFQRFIVLTKQEEVARHIGDGSKYGVEVRVCMDPPVRKVGKGKALVHAIRTGCLSLGERIFIVFPDDIFLDFTLPLRFLASHLEAVRRLDVWGSVAVVTGLQLPYGVVELEPRGLARKFEEKPNLGIYVSAGLYILEPNALKLLVDNVDVSSGEAVEFEQLLLPVLAEKSKLHAFTIPQGVWQPVNTIKELEEAIAKLASNAVIDL